MIFLVSNRNFTLKSHRDDVLLNKIPKINIVIFFFNRKKTNAIIIVIQFDFLVVVGLKKRLEVLEKD